MRQTAIICGCAAALLLASAGYAQMPGVTMEMIRTALPLDGAPRATHGPYHVLAEPAFESPRHVVYRPDDLRAFPNEDWLPIVVWGNGGCAINSDNYHGLLTTIASRGFLTLATTAIEGEEPRQANTEDLRAAIDWAEAENVRSDSPLFGKIDTEQVAVMGTSCGGYRAMDLGSDPRVTTIGVFNSGAMAADREGRSPTAPAFEALAGIHGPVLLINGDERDFLMQESRDTFDALHQVPAFYGARRDAGHTATIFHPGGGEFANVGVAWLMFHFKSDKEAGRMFVGPNCGLCTDENWETDSRGLNYAAVQTAATERVVMRHLAASKARDASVVPRDYADDAVVVFGDTATRGVEGIQRVFEDLYARTPLDLDYVRRVFFDEVGFVVWTMDDLTGSDTFVVRDGKIVVQTGIVFRNQ
jgi:hypothetical protein